MILWKCDGCSRVKESRVNEYYGTGMIMFATKPRGWWTGYKKISSAPGSPNKLRLLFHACCGECIDRVDEGTESEIKWGRGAPGMMID